MERIEIQGYKSIKQLDIELRLVNILIGAIGLHRIREKCPRFDRWINKLEQL